LIDIFINRANEDKSIMLYYYRDNKGVRLRLAATYNIYIFFTIRKIINI
jgi:hypothetical protein